MSDVILDSQVDQAQFDALIERLNTLATTINQEPYRYRLKPGYIESINSYVDDIEPDVWSSLGANKHQRLRVKLANIQLCSPPLVISMHVLELFLNMDTLRKPPSKNPQLKPDWACHGESWKVVLLNRMR